MKSEDFREDLAGNDRRFDRLVDGSLPADEYRALLAALDDEPGGWRKCALAFLEAQALDNELRGLVPAKEPHRPPRLPSKRRVAPGQQASLVLAVAASVMAALTLGILSPRFLKNAAKEPAVVGNLIPRQPETAAVATDDAARHRVLRPVGNVKLVVDDDDAVRSPGEVPVYEVSADLEAMLAREEAALGPDVLDLFRAHGFEVRHEQQYVPAPLDDGRQVIVPLHGYEIRPVGRTY